VDLIPNPLFFIPGSAGNRTRASGSVAKNSDHETTEVDGFMIDGEYFDVPEIMSIVVVKSK
jgi:hypothetical protein